MKIFELVIILIWLIMWLVCCVPRLRKDSKTMQKIDKTTGEIIAVDHLVQEYEKEHKKFYEEKIGGGGYLEWSALDNKDICGYCRQFLQHSVPGRKFDNLACFKIRRVLNYEKGNTGITSVIVLVHCKVIRSRSLSYYITRAPEPTCVYAVKCTHNKAKNIFTIIHKYCDFEITLLKRKRVEIVNKVQRRTRQPIAKDEYLLQYELDHQELLKREGGILIEWPYAKLHNDLDYYCYQYLGECVPARNMEGIKGNWKTEKLHYQKLKSYNNILVTTVICWLPDITKYRYHITRALETNCVYALLRKGCNSYSPFVIGFKHCDFVYSSYKKIISQDYNTSERHVVPKIELKEELLDTLQTQPLPPENQEHLSKLRTCFL